MAGIIMNEEQIWKELDMQVKMDGIGIFTMSSVFVSKMNLKEEILENDKKQIILKRQKA